MKNSNLKSKIYILIDNLLNNFMRHKKFKIGNYILTMNATHQLPVYLDIYPHYSMNIVRIAKYLNMKIKNLKVIDVGGNIGDTACMIKNEVNVQVLTVEGDTFYLKYLHNNVKQLDKITVFEGFLGKYNTYIDSNIDRKNGTLSLKKNSNKLKKISINRLDTVLDNYALFKSSKLIKIDTDGFDFDILRGASAYLRKTHPIIFMEYDSTFFKKSSDGIKILGWLSTLGYSYAIYYDNYGIPVTSVDINNADSINLLDAYIANEHRHFEYYDVCLFHKTDSLFYRELIVSELNYFKNTK